MLTLGVMIYVADDDELLDGRQLSQTLHGASDIIAQAVELDEKFQAQRMVLLVRWISRRRWIWIPRLDVTHHGATILHGELAQNNNIVCKQSG